MVKVAKVSFYGHPVLGDLALDFRDAFGNIPDTIIIAGENGCGKSILLSSLYCIVSRSVSYLGFEADVVFWIDGVENTLSYRTKDTSYFRALTHESDGSGFDALLDSFDNPNRLLMSAIYSDVGVSFDANDVTSVTSMGLDESGASRKSSRDFASDIKQLLVDIQASDDAALAYAMRTNPGLSRESLHVEERMSRFTSAFDVMFDHLSYDRVESVEGRKEIVFKKGGNGFPIDMLSSGEKQVVYRGCYLLRDAFALAGAIALIDEPEISLHPAWQSKVLSYYKAIFSDSSGCQTSQIFVATHSPFIVHAERQEGEKVIVLKRDADGLIEVMDRPEYYKCNSVELVQDAFDLGWYRNGSEVVYLEGRTDERYFNSAVDAFELDIPFEFRWIGYVDENGEERFSGSSSLDKAKAFLLANDPSEKTVCLYDCDEKRSDISQGNVRILSIPFFENSKSMKKGIENALILDSVDLSPFYIQRENTGSYGEVSLLVSFNKMGLCDYVCSLGRSERKVIFKNLAKVIESVANFFIG